MSETQKQNWDNPLWSEREEKILVAYSFTFKNQWKLYEEFLPGRSAQAIRQKWRKLTRSVRTLKKEEEEVVVDLFREEEPEKQDIQPEKVEIPQESLLSWFKFL
jgi:hypothetical protein